MERGVIRVILTVLLIGGGHAEQEYCDKDSPECSSRKENKFSVHGFLAEVERVARKEDRVNMIKTALQSHPEEPDILLALTKEYMSMFERLHPKMRGIGEIELVSPAIEIYMKLLRMPAEKMTDEKHAEIVDHCITSVVGSSNKTASVLVIKEALERMNKAIDMQTYKYYFESLVEEHFLARDYTEAVELVEKVQAMFPGKHVGLKLLSAIIHRFNEISNKQPHVVSQDMVRKLRPRNDDDKRGLILYTRELETQLRSLKRVNETDIMFEISAELGLFPSKYQRANMQVEGLRAAPVWETEETGQEGHLTLIEEQWKVIRNELKNLTQELEDWEWFENRELESKGLWGQFFFLGNGVTSLDIDGRHCKITPTFCNIMKKFTTTLNCALCEVKLEYVDVGAHIVPHCGATNAKLRAHIPVTTSKDAHMKIDGTPSFRLRVAEQIVQWEDGKFTVWDNSFENEMHNESGTAQVILVIDFKHPELQPEDDIMDPRLWEISEPEEGGAPHYQLRPELMS